MNEGPSAASEWHAHWLLVMSAMLGYSAVALHTFGIGPFVPYLEKAFGWSRAEMLLALSLSTLTATVLTPLVGYVIDRVGSRWLGLSGIVLMALSYAALGTANGSLLNWYLLYAGVGIALAMTNAPVWTRVVAARFTRSRGLALASTLCGSSLGAAFMPALAAVLMPHLGWRASYAGIAAIWLLVVMPFIIMFFHERSDSRPAPIAGDAKDRPEYRHGLSWKEGIRTRPFFLLTFAFVCFTFFSNSTASNLIPLLINKGAGFSTAAGIASILGLVGLAARISTGVLLDRFNGAIVGFFVMLLPVAGSALLMLNPGPAMMIGAVALFGAAIGAEMDVVIYLTTRHLGLKAFGVLFSLMITVGAVFSAIGPIAGGGIYDHFRSYDPLLLINIAAMILGAIAIAATGRPPKAWSGGEGGHG